MKQKDLFWEIKQQFRQLLKWLVVCQYSTSKFAGDESLGTVLGFQYFWYSKVFLGLGCSQGEFRIDPRWIQSYVSLLDISSPAPLIPDIGSREADVDQIPVQCTVVLFCLALNDVFLNSLLPGESPYRRNAYISANCIIPTGTRTAWE